MELTYALKALAEPTRLSIVKHLLARNYCVGALAKLLGISDAAISQHLKVLKEAGLLSGVKRGYFMHYEVDREALQRVAREIESLLDGSPTTLPNCKGAGQKCDPAGRLHGTDQGESDGRCSCGTS